MIKYGKQSTNIMPYLFLQVYLALVGVFGIGLAILVSYGLASAIGMFYGPIHPILPFLLLGK